MNKRNMASMVIIMTALLLSITTIVYITLENMRLKAANTNLIETLTHNMGAAYVSGYYKAYSRARAENPYFYIDEKKIKSDSILYFRINNVK